MCGSRILLLFITLVLVCAFAISEESSSQPTDAPQATNNGTDLSGMIYERWNLIQTIELFKIESHKIKTCFLLLDHSLGTSPMIFNPVECVCCFENKGVECKRTCAKTQCIKRCNKSCVELGKEQQAKNEEHRERFNV